jgi:hypothetical protein
VCIDIAVSLKVEVPEEKPAVGSEDSAGVDDQAGTEEQETSLWGMMSAAVEDVRYSPYNPTAFNPTTFAQLISCSFIFRRARQ